jgi:hypothetical protein
MAARETNARRAATARRPRAKETECGNAKKNEGFSRVSPDWRETPWAFFMQKA